MPPGVLLTVEELPLVQRAVRALLVSHGGVCKCKACLSGRPLLARIDHKLATPVPRPIVDQGEQR